MTASPLARLVVVLLPVALVGLLARAYYTPDEPREASMVVAMASQPDKSLPTLAGKPFAEKPPLLYWLGGASVAAFGPSPAATRLPNLVYLLLAAVAIAALVARAAGPLAGFAAGVVVGTALQLYQVLIWLATDAPLMAGVAVALYGTYRALVAATARERLVGYCTLHAGLLVAFFAKGFAGWLVPVSAWLTVVLLERRWREFVCRELWGGGLVVLAVIGLWALWVGASPGGTESLRVLFWYNLVGRVVPLAAPPELAYASGHGNSPGKYLAELPLYLLPWTPLALVALGRLPRTLRRRDAEGTAWRLGFGAIALPTLLLSLAATARGVYYGPPALGFAILVGLYVGSAATALDRWDRFAWRATAVLVALLALLLAALLGTLAVAPAGRTPEAAVLLGGAAAVLTALAVAALVRRPRTGAWSFPFLAFTLAATLSVGLLPVYLRLNDWLGLEPLAARIERAAAGAPLGLLDPDETTLALAALYLPASGPHAVLESRDAATLAAERAALGAGGTLLWLVPDRRRWNLGAWLALAGFDGEVPSPPTVTPPAGLGDLAVACVWSRPGGRSYALLAPPPPPAACP